MDGMRIFDVGDIAQETYVLTAGVATIEVPDDSGQKQSLIMCGEGSVLGAESFFSGLMMPFAVTIHGGISTVLKITDADRDALFEAFPEQGRNIMGQLSVLLRDQGGRLYTTKLGLTFNWKAVNQGFIGIEIRKSKRTAFHGKLQSQVLVEEKKQVAVDSIDTTMASIAALTAQETERAKRKRIQKAYVLHTLPRSRARAHIHMRACTPFHSMAKAVWKPKASNQTEKEIASSSTDSEEIVSMDGSLDGSERSILSTSSQKARTKALSVAGKSLEALQNFKNICMNFDLDLMAQRTIREKQMAET